MLGRKTRSQHRDGRAGMIKSQYRSESLPHTRKNIGDTHMIPTNKTIVIIAAIIEKY